MIKHMMRKMGYNLLHGKGLNLGKGRRGFLRNFVPRGKLANYYDNTRRVLGYVTPTPLATVQFKDKPIPSHCLFLRMGLGRQCGNVVQGTHR